MFVKFTILFMVGIFVSAYSQCDTHKPVCGANNVTYQNSCRCQEAEVEVAHTGKCKQTSEQQQGGLTEYTMRDSSQRTPSVNTVKYMLAPRQNEVPEGPFMAETAGPLKVTDEFTSGDWEWKHGVHEAMNTFKYDQRPALNPFEWTKARVNSWDPVKENVTVYDSLAETEASEDWDFVKEEDWAKKMEWTGDINDISFGDLVVEETVVDNEPLDVSQDEEVQSWVNADGVEGGDEGVDLVGNSLY